MSFIYENDLDLLLAGLGAQDLLKKAQQAAGQPAGDWNARGQVAFYLLNNLKSQIESPVSTESGINHQAQATIGDLDSLETFAKWLADQKVTWNSNRISWRAGDQRPDEALEVPVTDNEHPDVKHEPEVFVSKPDLLAYLSHLRDNVAGSNKTLQLKLNAIISDVNTHLMTKGEKPLSTKPSIAPSTSPGTVPTNVAVPGSGAIVPGKPGVTSPAVPGHDSKPGKPGVTPQIMSQVVEAVPLRVTDINFDRIRAFFELYGTVVAGDRASSVSKAINDATTAMTDASALTVNGMRSFSMSAGPSQVISWLKPPQGGRYLPLIGWLKTVLQNTQYVLQDLRDTYGDAIGGQSLLGPTDRARVLSQVGDGRSESIFDSNWDQLRALESQINQVHK